jgi:LSD1 subclass zinc finger protein
MTDRKINCPNCYKLLMLPEGKDAGDKMTCPICDATFEIATQTVYVPKK